MACLKEGQTWEEPLCPETWPEELAHCRRVDVELVCAVELFKIGGPDGGHEFERLLGFLSRDVVLDPFWGIVTRMVESSVLNLTLRAPA